MNDRLDGVPGTRTAARATDWITTPITSDLLRGALDLERTEHGVLPHRLPARARAQCADGQPAMAHLDGRDLYGEADFAELPLPDQLHPDAATHRRIGERFAALAFGSGGPLAAERA